MMSTHQLRCTGCATRIDGVSAPSDFRCPVCARLYEVVYPWSDAEAGTSSASLPNPSALRWLWQERRTSSMALDQSGVWRFRDLLPIVKNFDHVTTLREGNAVAGHPLGAGQAPRHESDRVVQGYGDDGGFIGGSGAWL